MSVDAVGLIAIPVTMFLLGAAFAAVRGAIRFAQYMVRTEEAQARTADSNEEMSKKLDAFMERTDSKIAEHAQMLAIHDYELARINGRPPRRAVPDPN